ncbi:MAG: phosphoglucomutase, partial [Ignavibacteria bacterium]|nr:phosphoglucomutase [Ignavibacteria bacterium]
SYDIQVETIFGEPKEDFSGRDAEPIEKNLIPLKEKLISEKIYSLGVATDGDADRVGIMLDNGEWLSAQETILLLIDYIINSRNVSGNIVKTSSVTDKIFEFFQSDKRKVYDVQVGFKYICEKMISEDIAIGCEESGGYGFKFHIPERDGILSALIFTEMLAKSNFNKLSPYVYEKRKLFGNIYYNRVDYPYFNEDRIEKLEKLISNLPPKVDNFVIDKIKKFYNAKGYLNGLKLIFEGSTRWLLLRSSETEPMIRVYAEGQSNEEVVKILNCGIKLITN